MALDPEKPDRYRMFAGPVTSRPSSCSRVSDSTSSESRSSRASGMLGDVRDHGAQAKLVARGAEAADNADGRARKDRVPSLRLPRVDVAEMHFDERDRCARECVANRKTCMRVGTCIHQRAIHLAAPRVNDVDHLAFAVVLDELERRAE